MYHLSVFICHYLSSFWLLLISIGSVLPDINQLKVTDYCRNE
jgi:hypothetical protein